MGCFYSDSISTASYGCIRRVLLCPQIGVWSVPAQPHRYHRHKPAPYLHLHRCPSDSSLSVYSLGDTTTDATRYATNSQTQQTRALQGSLMYAVPSNESYQHYQDRYQDRPSFHSHNPYQGWPRTRINIPRQVNAHGWKSSRCTLLSLLTNHIYLGIITLVYESQCTHKAVVPLASLCTAWTIASVSVCLFV